MNSLEFINNLSRKLRDVSERQWQRDILVEAVNDALRTLCAVKHDVYTTRENIPLVAGTEQTTPSDAYRLISLMNNVCPTTGALKRAIRQGDISVMDDVYPHWRQDAAIGYIKEWFLNESEACRFEVWPPANGPTGEGCGEEPVVPDVPVAPDEPTQGASQAELDQYQIDLAAYNVLLTEYNTAVAAKAAYDLCVNPVEPAIPVDPGPQLCGISPTEPTIENECIPRTAGLSFVNDGLGNTFVIDGLSAGDYDVLVDEELVVIDFSTIDADIPVVPTDDAFTLKRGIASGETSDPARRTIEHVFGNEAANLTGNTSNNFLSMGDVRLAIDAGTPYMIVQYKHGTNNKVYSPFAASIADLPRFIKVQEIAPVNAGLPPYENTTYDLSAVPLSPNFGTTAGTNFINTAGAADIPAMQAIPEGSFFIVPASGNSSALYTSTFGLVHRATTFGPDLLRYDISVLGFQSSGLPHSFFSNTGSNTKLFYMLTQATPTEPGEVMYIANGSNIRDYVALPPDKDSVFQAELAAYLLELAAYDSCINSGGTDGGTEAEVAERNALIAQYGIDVAAYPAALIAYNQALQNFSTGNETVRAILAKVPCVEDKVALIAALGPVPTDEAELEIYNEQVEAINNSGTFDLLDELPAKKVYISALMEWALYYCYSVDDEMTANNGRGLNHFKAFFNLIGEKINNDMKILASRTGLEK